MTTPRKNPILILALCSLPALAVDARQADQIVPVHQEPRHHLVFDSPGTRILDIQIPPGDTTLFHTHSDPILYVTMSTSQTRSQTLGAEWSGTPAAAAMPVVPVATARVVPSKPPGRMMSTTSYSEKALTHRVNNIGDSLFRLIGITNASAGDSNSAPSSDFPSKPELENRWFRGYRWLLAEQPTDEHRHVNPVAIVLVSGAAAALIADTRAPLDKPGAFVFIEPSKPHRLVATGPDSQVVEVEVRRPR